VKVVLNPFEMRMARGLGNLRQERRAASGAKNAHGSTGGVEDHILGVMGEMAFAKVTNRYPSGLFLDMGEDNDVGGIQVRTRRKHDMELYLWKKDRADAWWVLMTGAGPEFVFRGAIHGAEAATERFWTPKKRPFPRVSCWVIPQGSLMKPGEFLAELALLAEAA
jgi:hypothetical protein